MITEDGGKAKPKQQVLPRAAVHLDTGAMQQVVQNAKGPQRQCTTHANCEQQHSQDGSGLWALLQLLPSKDGKAQLECAFAVSQPIPSDGAGAFEL